MGSPVEPVPLEITGMVEAHNLEASWRLPILGMGRRWLRVGESRPAEGTWHDLQTGAFGPTDSVKAGGICKESELRDGILLEVDADYNRGVVPAVGGEGDTVPVSLRKAVDAHNGRSRWVLPTLLPGWRWLSPGEARPGVYKIHDLHAEKPHGFEGCNPHMPYTQAELDAGVVIAVPTPAGPYILADGASLVVYPPGTPSVIVQAVADLPGNHEIPVLPEGYTWMTPGMMKPQGYRFYDVRRGREWVDGTDFASIYLEGKLKAGFLLAMPVDALGAEPSLAYRAASARDVHDRKAAAKAMPYVAAYVRHIGIWVMAHADAGNTGRQWIPVPDLRDEKGEFLTEGVARAVARLAAQLPSLRGFFIQVGCRGEKPGLWLTLVDTSPTKSEEGDRP